ncbi:hypothetical protein EUTSA_v10002031mg [Eutrema salsugineum]|uniref:Replication protein A 70 kDa DNA-binding subunit B/D first OB fold domain-containing protein n=2 Tax=Eutrema salsugineum TaxID=72664 RepID=V4LIB2_EUTSA|nr:hypothetical protein EUTSA_v10002031mg [Eutrema salsugineum]
MGVELLLIDTKSTTMQGFISANRLFRYKQALKANSIYKMKNFMITDCKTLYKVSSHKHGISFTNHTTFDEQNDADHKIDTQQFRLRTFQDLAPIVDRHCDLYDIIGHIRLIKGDNLHNPTPMSVVPETPDGKQDAMVFLHVQMKDGETVRIYLWDKIAAKFRTRWNESETKPAVILITTINPKTVGDAIALSSTSATRLFFDSDISETKEFPEKLGTDGESAAAVNSSSSAVTKLETVTLNEIQKFVQDETPQIASFVCTATIVDVLREYGWNFISCTGCKNKMRKSETSLFCTNPKCKKPNNLGLLSYRIEVAVRDTNGLATFVLFDSEVTKLCGREAPEVMNKMKAV